MRDELSDMMISRSASEAKIVNIQQAGRGGGGMPLQNDLNTQSCESIIIGIIPPNGLTNNKYFELNKSPGKSTPSETNIGLELM